MPVEQLSLDSVAYAFRRLSDFADVHQDKSIREKIEPISHLFTSLGLGEDQILMSSANIREMGAGPHEESAFFLGLIVGLFIMQYHE